MPYIAVMLSIKRKRKDILRHEKNLCCIKVFSCVRFESTGFESSSPRCIIYEFHEYSA